MTSIGAELQQVLDLAPGYTRESSPLMHARDQAVRRLQGELRRVLAAMPDAVSSTLDVAVGGQQGSYSPLAWVRIYSPEHSPNATAGVYLAYLFAADGSQVYLSLQQGSSEVRSGRMRPVHDPMKLLASGAAARSAIQQLIHSPLGAGMATEIDLRWRGLSSVGSYSKQRIRNYEYANILAIEYCSDAIPGTSTLIADIHRGVVLLTALYGDAEPAMAASLPESGKRSRLGDGPVVLDDDDPLWAQHSGGTGHSGVEWGAGDCTLAEKFYAALPAKPRLVLDLLMDRPGERLTSDWIATQLSTQPGGSEGTPGRHTVSGSLSSVVLPHSRSGRRLPFYWWRQRQGRASSYAMKPSVARLFREARQKVNGDHADPGGGDWSPGEVTAVVDDYLVMLQAEIAGQSYSKAEHRRALLTRLNPRRTAGAVEYKHQNISAAMLELGLPYIRGYKPMSNYQTALTAEIQRHLETDPKLLRTLRTRSHDGTPRHSRLRRTPAPTAPDPPSASPGIGNRTGRHPDYGLLHEENSRRGEKGEELVLRYEREQLRQHGRPDLADAVRWTAREDGDGLGYDVLSFSLDGHERYIEVKATALGDRTPFYISSAELDFAQRHVDRYALYRVYDLDGEPRFFALEGDITKILELIPVTYRARITAPW